MTEAVTPESRVCADCAGPVSRQSTGRCRACALRHHNADPLMQERRRAAIKAKFADPEHRARHAARLAARNRTPTPALRAAMQANGRRAAAVLLGSPEMRAVVNDPAVKAANGRKRTETTLAWRPPDYRDAYRKLKASQRMSAADARASIEAQIAADARRREAALTPFERQLARVRAGARLIDKPVLRRADPAFTLGGVSPEAM